MPVGINGTDFVPFRNGIAVLRTNTIIKYDALCVEITSMVWTLSVASHSEILEQVDNEVKKKQKVQRWSTFQLEIQDVGRSQRVVPFGVTKWSDPGPTQTNAVVWICLDSIFFRSIYWYPLTEFWILLFIQLRPTPLWSLAASLTMKIRFLSIRPKIWEVNRPGTHIIRYDGQSIVGAV